MNKVRGCSRAAQIWTAPDQPLALFIWLTEYSAFRLKGQQFCLCLELTSEGATVGENNGSCNEAAALELVREEDEEYMLSPQQ